MITFLWQGILLSLAIAVPVGPMTFLCMNRTIQLGKKHGLITGLGIAIADTLYASIGAFGLTAISAWLLRYQWELNLAGGTFLLYLGLQTMRSLHPLPQPSPADQKEKSSAVAFFSAVALTLSSPATLLLFASVFSFMDTGNQVDETEKWRSASAMVGGFFLGSMSWWTLVVLLLERLRGKLTKQILRRINIVSGAVLIGFALFAFWKAQAAG